MARKATPRSNLRSCVGSCEATGPAEFFRVGPVFRFNKLVCRNGIILTRTTRMGERRAMRAPPDDHARAGAANLLARLQVPAAARSNRALRQREQPARLVRKAGLVLDDAVDDTAFFISPLNAGGP